MDLFDKVTVLIYTFPRKGDEKDAFGKIAAAIERTWKFCGRLKTVIVASHRFAAAENFAAAHPNVELQIEDSLVYGDIKTMSLDCITKLYTRFSTPYVLIIQDDGYPVRAGLEEFVGKWDFIGAPSVRDERRRLMNHLGFPCLNGGFSLRSHRICVRAANAWNRWWRFFLDPSSRFFSEDTFYTLTACLGWGYRHGLKFAGEKDAFRFSYDPLKGLVTRPQGIDSFGIHGRVPEVTVLAYHFWKKDGYEEAFAKVRHAFEETWRHCGRRKSVLVVNEAAPCVERFAAENDNVEVQVEESLVPGRIFTMSADMNGRLWKRFSTSYVLIIQSDGYPLRPGLEAFVGKYDFIGAPYVGLQWWKTLAAGFANYHVQNGGFSLRSRRICEAAAEYWNGKYHALGDTRDASEDIFYTGTLVRKERKYRKSFRFATSREALKFSWDASVPIPRPGELPFGFHGKETAKVVEGGAAWRS
jgi:hypothetical protein